MGRSRQFLGRYRPDAAQESPNLPRNGPTWSRKSPSTPPDWHRLVASAQRPCLRQRAWESGDFGFGCGIPRRQGASARREHHRCPPTRFVGGKVWASQTLCSLFERFESRPPLCDCTERSRGGAVIPPRSCRFNAAQEAATRKPLATTYAALAYDHHSRSVARARQSHNWLPCLPWYDSTHVAQPRVQR